ncbi:FAD-dependent oxidoreductase [Streptomyces decoyicus]|uniref:FAD-dependent oxidoreductase n=1 Tax=Streptomyces decoyicus TaxID=249567 RepID=UPI003F4B8080
MRLLRRPVRPLRRRRRPRTRRGRHHRRRRGESMRDAESHLAPDLAGGVLYPQDAQVQPALAAAHLLRASGARLHLGAEVTAVLRGPGGVVRGVRTPRGDLLAPAVVNAAGTWAGRLASLAPCSRRGWCCRGGGSWSRAAGRRCWPLPDRWRRPVPRCRSSPRSAATPDTPAPRARWPPTPASSPKGPVTRPLCSATASASVPTARSPPCTAPTGSRPSP